MRLLLDSFFRYKTLYKNMYFREKISPSRGPRHDVEAGIKKQKIRFQLTTRCDTAFSVRHRRLAFLLPHQQQHPCFSLTVSHHLSNCICKRYDKAEFGRSPEGDQHLLNSVSKKLTDKTPQKDTMSVWDRIHS